MSRWSETTLRGALALAFATLLVALPARADDAARGAELFEQRCATCHSLEPTTDDDWQAVGRREGPSLFGAGSRFRDGWISRWLVAPSRIRPAGFIPSEHTAATPDGDRVDPSTLPVHPAATPEDAAAIEDFLATLTAPEVPFPQETPSSGIRASVHFSKLLPCGGCHRSGSAGGGVSGPDLTRVGERLQPEWLRSALWDPAARGIRLMPKSRLRGDQLSTLAAFLEDGGADGARDGREGYLLADGEPVLEIPPAEGRAARIYRLLCSQCHGLLGNGRGINAPFLFVAPRDHTSSEQMGRLSDQQIRSAIGRGGAAVGKSTAMPAWGGVLDDDEIDLLVGYLRRLSGTVSR